MSATMLKSFNEFVKNFLKENLDETIQESILEKWEEAQTDLKKSLKTQEKKAEKKKEKKAAKDPNAPKKNKSAYIFFCIDERKNIKDENPEMSAKEIIAELGSRWKQMKEEGDGKLKTYEQMAQDDKSRYNTESGNTDGNKSKSKKDDKKIKKNKSAYIFFCEDVRPIVKAENPDMSAKDIIRELANRWKDAKNDSEIFESYKEKEIADKERYAQEKESESENDSENESKSKKVAEKKPVKKNKKKTVNEEEPEPVKEEEKPKKSKKTEKKTVTEKPVEKKTTIKSKKFEKPKGGFKHAQSSDYESDNESLIDDISSDEDDDDL